jgi:hypothetical protein
MPPPQSSVSVGPRSETGPLLMLYLFLCLLAGLVAAGHFLQQPILGGMGFLLFAALLAWYLLLWPLGSLTAATVWQFCLGMLLGATVWFCLVRFVLVRFVEVEDNGQLLFLNGLAFVAVGSGVLGWLLLRLLRRRPTPDRRPVPPPPPLPPAAELTELDDL